MTAKKGTSRITVKKKNGAPTKSYPRELTLEEILGRKQPRRMEVRIYLDPSLEEEITKAESDLKYAEARHRLSDALADSTEADQMLVDARRVLDQLRSREKDESVVFRFRSVSRKKVEDALADHPPTGEQRARFARQLREMGESTNRVLPYNEETFPPVLIAMSCEYPEMTEEQTREIWVSDDWSRAELGMLMAAAWAVNEVVS